MKTFSLVLLLSLSSAVVIAQRRPIVEPSPPAVLAPAVSSAQQGELQLPSLKRPGHYTAKDWGHLIDSLWGDGMSTTEKLSVFDRYWNLVDQTWGGFPNLVVNWDSLKNVYRPMVESGVSRGRFYGILCRLSRALNEVHVFTKDRGIDTTMGFYEHLEVDGEYPNYPSFHYRPGLPIICANNLWFRDHFGAGLTPLPDSTAVVYRVMPNHPLNLQPGDVILGYDGIPWKDLMQELLDAELPILGFVGSSPAAEHHAAMISVGMNWGLFDTIDVVKYTTKDTLHYPTSLLGTIAPPYFVATEQLPVNGVPFPDIDNTKMVSWGIVEGTTIGYVYAWDWATMPAWTTRPLFAKAVDELVRQQKVQGLILDFRTNGGGWPENANDGYRHLFNFDPTLNYSPASRVRGGPHLSFTLTPKYVSDEFSPGPELFDHPIAVLTGPMTCSAGDYNAFKMRFHPMARFFGKTTNCAYTAWTDQLQFGVLAGPYFCRVDDASVFSHFNNEGFMMHKGFPVDEEVWLTRDGVAKGEDDVVKRALEWISTLTYAHDVACTRGFARPGEDTVSVTARMANPLSHSAVISAIVTDTAGIAYDSLQMFDDGSRGDRVAGDSIWSCHFRAPLSENFFGVAIQTEDLTQGTFRRLPNVVRFTTAGPVVVDSIAARRTMGSYVRVDLWLRNQGRDCVIPSVKAVLRTTDPVVDSFIVNNRSFGNLSPGQRHGAGVVFYFTVDTSVHTADIPLTVDVSSNGQFNWTSETTARLTTGVIASDLSLPREYRLDQNYPNPFNPSTTIKYELPQRAHVVLAVFNMLGQLVATLVQREEDAGYHEVEFDASSLASGVYVYRLQVRSPDSALGRDSKSGAGDFVQSRKMICVR